jgi:hypothetical protein
MNFCGGVDVKLIDKMWCRSFEGNHPLTRPNENNIHNQELSAGLAFRFGTKQKAG